MGDIVINADTFFDRLSALYNSWKADKRSGDGSFGGADSMVVLTGKADQDTHYTKSNALHVGLHENRFIRQTATDQIHSFGFWATSSPRR